MCSTSQLLRDFVRCTMSKVASSQIPDHHKGATGRVRAGIQFYAFANLDKASYTNTL